MPREIKIDEIDALRLSLANTRVAESRAVCNNLQLSLQRETTIAEDRQRSLDTLRQEVWKKYGMSPEAVVNFREEGGNVVATATDPIDAAPPAPTQN